MEDLQVILRLIVFAIIYTLLCLAVPIYQIFQMDKPWTRLFKGFYIGEL